MNEDLHFDVVIIGAGPAGLSAAIRLAQLNKDLKIAIFEKGAAIGSHILSGAVLETRALNELIPDWQSKNAPIKINVTQDKFLYLSKTHAFNLPTPPQMRNKNNYIISLGELCRWLASEAEAMGVNIFPGFAVTEILHNGGNVIGVRTGNMGIDKNNQHTERFQPGVEIYAQHTLLAEGCRGSLTKEIIKRYKLDARSQPQTYGLGIKELWEVPDEQHQLGKVIHTIGWPLHNDTYGGSFIYHFENNQVAVGFVVGLDYTNPYLDPFKEFQRFKTHPAICKTFKNAKRLAYGARSLNEGGWQSIPKLDFPGGMLIGDCAGFLNVPKIKGIHTAMKSGMLAAEALHKKANKYELSWIKPELYKARNIRPSFRWGTLLGVLYSAIDTYIFRGHAPWTFTHKKDHESLKPAKNCKKINYPKPDNEISFNKLSSVYLSNTNHEENQPCHLKIINKDIPIDVNLKEYDSPETRYCPAAVYEIVNLELQINAQNCLHCKACDIKDPKQNIHWTPPEGGGGPNYSNL